MFDPPLDLDVINTMLFNVIPERDIVPKVSLDVSTIQYHLFLPLQKIHCFLAAAVFVCN